MQLSVITAKDIERASNKERCHMMIDIIKGKAKYMEDYFDAQTDFD